MPLDFDDEKFEEINPEFYLQDEDPEQASLEKEEVLDELSQQFVNKLIDKMMDFLKVPVLIKSDSGVVLTSPAKADVIAASNAAK